MVLPAYNAEKTLEATWQELPDALRADVLLVDDASTDRTVAVASSLGIPVIRHCLNRGYGANQKTCYQAALRAGAELVVMLHPDHQYDAGAIPALIAPLLRGDADVGLGSRLLGRDPRRDGMPGWRYWGNRALTACQNWILGTALTEYHTGLRAWRREVLEAIPFMRNADGYLFDAQMLAQAYRAGARVAETATRCRYEEESSSISLTGAVRYGTGSLLVATECRISTSIASICMVRPYLRTQEILAV